jgi:hypothetical protein
MLPIRERFWEKIMKRIIYALLSIVITIMLFTGVLWAFKRRQSVNVRLNVKDLPEHSLYITTPTDPSFDDMVSTYAKGQANATNDLSKSFSVFISNFSTRAVVAYRIKWELLRSDGKLLMHTESYSEPGLLMGRSLGESNSQLDEDSNVIRPNASKLVSWVTSMALNNATDSSHEPDAALNQLKTHFLSATALTVSIDGIFFEDGTFVGQNTTGYYEQIEAQIKARRDLVDSIRLAVKKRGEIDEVFSSIERASQAEDVRVNYDTTPAEFYNLYKKIFARELTGMRNAYGQKKAIAYALELQNRPWARLRKE